MNIEILNKYDVIFYRRSDQSIIVRAASGNLSIYLTKFAKQMLDIDEFLSVINVALNGQYSSIEETETYWPQYLADNQYVGSIESSSVFELYIADHYENTIETFPLFEVREIFMSLLEFLKNDV